MSTIKSLDRIFVFFFGVTRCFSLLQLLTPPPSMFCMRAMAAPYKSRDTSSLPIHSANKGYRAPCPLTVILNHAKRQIVWNANFPQVIWLIWRSPSGWCLAFIPMKHWRMQRHVRLHPRYRTRTFTQFLTLFGRRLHICKSRSRKQNLPFLFFIHISEPATTHYGHLFCLFLHVSLSRGHVGFCFICARSSPIELHWAWGIEVEVELPNIDVEDMFKAQPQCCPAWPSWGVIPKNLPWPPHTK